MISMETSNGKLCYFLLCKLSIYNFFIANRIVEVFSWLLEVANDTKEHWDGSRIVWSVSYVHDGPKTKDMSAEAILPHEEHRKKLVAKLEIQKDDIQSVLPISKVCDACEVIHLESREQEQEISFNFRTGS